LVNDVPDELKKWFDLLVFPSLEKFGYEGTKICDFPLNALISFFDRSHCQLTHFNLSGDLWDVTTDTLISLFSALPTLTHFKLEDIEYRSTKLDGIMTDKLLQKLTPTQGIRAGLLPCLQSLKFRGKQTFSWNGLADFISTGLTEENNHGFVNPTTDQTNVGQNSPVFQHQNASRNSIRLVSFKVRSPRSFVDPNVTNRFNRARNAGVSIEIMHETLHEHLHSITNSLL
jgi:hypothetical protein